MPGSRDRPTLLVFTRGAEREARRRRLLPARLAALELALHHRCVAATLAAGRAAGCAIAVSSPAPLGATSPADRRLAQRGGGFGERLLDALGRARAESAGPVLVVGTDTPELTERHLREALARLDRRPGSVVLGPARDGGIYLLATRRPLDRVLAGIRWLRRETAASLRAALAAHGIEVSLLEPLSDLDRPQDLARWASRGARTEGAWRRLADRVHRALASLARLAAPAALGRPGRLAFARPGGRAPPRPF